MRGAIFPGVYPLYSITFVEQHLRMLRQAGHDLTLYVERPGEVPAQEPTQESMALKVHYEDMPDSPLRRMAGLAERKRWRWAALRAMNPWRFGWDGPALRVAWSAAVWPEGKYDYILCHFGANGRKAVQLREAGLIEGPVVTVFHGSDIHTYPKRFRYPIYRELFAWGDLFLTVSELGREQLLRMGCPEDRLHLLRMGVDKDFFRYRFRNPGQDYRILTIGRLVEAKGLRSVLKALSGLTGPWRWRIVGSGPEEKTLREMAAKFGVEDRVEFAGTLGRAGVREALDWAHVFVLTPEIDRHGEMEGIPVALMEAMAAGVAVVSTRHSGIPELIADGVSGKLVEEGDVLGIRLTLEDLLTKPGERERLARAARGVIEGEFDQAKWNERLLEFLWRTRQDSNL